MGKKTEKRHPFSFRTLEEKSSRQTGHSRLFNIWKFSFVCFLRERKAFASYLYFRFVYFILLFSIYLVFFRLCEREKYGRVFFLTFRVRKLNIFICRKGGSRVSLSHHSNDAWPKAPYWPQWTMGKCLNCICGEFRFRD